jgi:signal transduction histidine kinase
MTPFQVPHRWLGILFGVALLLDTAMVLGDFPTSSLLVLPCSALFAGCAWIGINRPAIGAIAGSLTLILSSIVLRLIDVGSPSVALWHMTITELIAGVVLVVLVVWRTPSFVATACVTALVVTCLAAMIVRETACSVGVSDAYCETYGASFLFFALPSNFEMSLVLGFILFVGSVATGLYLRRATRQRVETEMGALVRKQWPLGAALAIMALIELSEFSTHHLLGYVASVGAGVCAFFGTKYPLRNSYLAAAGLTLAAVLSLVAGSDGRVTAPLTGLAATMAITAYVVRYVRVRHAVGAVATLWAALLFASATRIGGDSLQDLSIGFVFLLFIAVATGWYFRARDRERNQTVRAAVTSAQQGERMALARELHDVVAHHVTGIVVQAQAALMVAGKNPEVALPALERIERSGTAALTAMRTLVGSLREGTAAWVAGADTTGDATTDLVADLQAVVEEFAGAPIKLDLDLPADLPHEMGRSVLRLVQESVTNVGKHAPDASAVHVRVASSEDKLHIRISDDGRKRPVNPVGGSGGYGLVGMRERVELLGGRFEAGPSGYVGWNVEAWLPLRKGD